MKLLVISDTHLTDRSTVCDANLDRIRSFVEESAVDLVFHLGDITADGSEHPAQLGYAAEQFAAFGVPVHFVPGNHDVGDNPMAPGRENIVSHNLRTGLLTPGCLADYRRAFGPDYWSLTLGPWQLVGLNAQLFGTDTEAEAEQLAWLRGMLQAGTGPLGLVLHKPLFRNGHADDEAHVRYVPAARRRALVELLAARDLKFVASGHVHQDRRIVVDGVEHVWVPSASFCMPDAMQERIGDKIVGVLTLELRGDGTHRFEQPVVDGLVLHNILHHPEIDPRMTALRAELGARAEL